MNAEERRRRSRAVTAAHAEAGHTIAAWGESKTISQWAADPRASVAIHTIYQRIHVLGWAAEAAIERPRRYESTAIVAWGETLSPTEWTADRRCRGASGPLISLRIKRGWAPEEAIATPVLKAPD